LYNDISNGDSGLYVITSCADGGLLIDLYNDEYCSGGPARSMDFRQGACVYWGGDFGGDDSEESEGSDEFDVYGVVVSATMTFQGVSESTFYDSAVQIAFYNTFQESIAASLGVDLNQVEVTGHSFSSGRRMLGMVEGIERLLQASGTELSMSFTVTHLISNDDDENQLSTLVEVTAEKIQEQINDNASLGSIMRDNLKEAGIWEAGFQEMAVTGVEVEEGHGINDDRQYLLTLSAGVGSALRAKSALTLTAAFATILVGYLLG